MRKATVPRKTLEPQDDGGVDLDVDIPVPTIRCVICGSDTHAGSVEGMCWVCRRLKISAWRDVEQQAPVQE